MRGEVNRKHNKRITKPCPVCGSRVTVANHGGIWWIACDADRTHIKQMFFHEPIDAIRWWNAKTNADRIRMMTDEELAEIISSLGNCDTCYLYLNRGCNINTSCKDAVLEWLRKDADEKTIRKTEENADTFQQS